MWLSQWRSSRGNMASARETTVSARGPRQSPETSAGGMRNMRGHRQRLQTWARGIESHCGHPQRPPRRVQNAALARALRRQLSPFGLSNRSPEISGDCGTSTALRRQLCQFGHPTGSPRQTQLSFDQHSMGKVLHLSSGTLMMPRDEQRRCSTSPRATQWSPGASAETAAHLGHRYCPPRWMAVSRRGPPSPALKGSPETTSEGAVLANETTVPVWASTWSPETTAGGAEFARAPAMSPGTDTGEPDDYFAGPTELAVETHRLLSAFRT